MNIEEKLKELKNKAKTLEIEIESKKSELKQVNKDAKFLEKEQEKLKQRFG